MAGAESQKRRTSQAEPSAGVARVIEERSGGAIVFHSATLYPTLYRLERKGLITGYASCLLLRERYSSLLASRRFLQAAARHRWIP